MNKSINFFGSYISQHTGSIGPSEFIAKALNPEGYKTRIISTNNNFVLRFVASLYTSFSHKVDLSFLDIYSSRVLIQSYLISRILTYRGEKYIAILHGGGIIERYQEIKKYLEPILQNSQTIISPSLYLQEGLKKYGFKVNYLPNPLDLSLFPYERAHEQSLKLLWVRAFDGIYNPSLAIEVLARVCKEFPGVTLTMIGPDKGELKTTKRLAEEYGILQLIDFTGPVPNDQLFKYYQTHDVFLNTTSYESFGIAVVEAASCGVPVVSFKVGEISLLWSDEEDILMAEFGDVEKMTDQVSRLFTDRSLSNKISLNARKKAEKFSWIMLRSIG